MGDGQAVAFFPQLQLVETGVLGAIETVGTYSGAQVFIEHSVVGAEINNAGPGTLSVWADGTNNETAGDIQGIGGFLGNVNMFHLSDVLVRNATPFAPSVTGWSWTDVRFENGGSFHFGDCDVEVHMDEQSFDEYQEAVDIVGCQGFVSLDSIVIQGGDPWVQQCDDASFEVWDGVEAFPTILGNIQNMVPGWYHVTAGAMIEKDNSAGAVIVDFGIWLDGFLVDCTKRTEKLGGAAAMAMAGSLTIDKIMFLTDGQVLTFEGTAPLNVGRLIATHYNFQIVKVGREILKCEGG